MRNGKYSVITCMLAVSLCATMQTASAAGEKKPVGRYSLKLIFALDKGLNQSCYKSAPPDLFAILDRDHPKRASQLTLRSNSPYESMKIVRSDPYDSTARIRYFTDEVVRKSPRVTMTLKGNMDRTQANESGVWTDDKGCSGKFIVDRRDLV